MEYEQALAHHQIGQHSTGDERQKHLDRAQEIFKQLGVDPTLDSRNTSPIN
jgi:hypothetical protein